MRSPISGTQFQRDVKLAQKRGKDRAKLREIVLLLLDFGDCPIEPGWLPICTIDGEDPHLVRTGTHSDLYGGAAEAGRTVAVSGDGPNRRQPDTIPVSGFFPRFVVSAVGIEPTTY